MTAKLKYPQPTGAAPMTIDGVTFYCVKTGPLRREWQTEDGKLRVQRNYNSTTFTAFVRDAPILSDIDPINNPKTKRFQTVTSAMSAAVRKVRT